MQSIAGKTICVTGATGYVGGRLVPLLLERGLRVRALVRSRKKALTRPWAGHQDVEIVETDLLDAASVRSGVAGCGAVYYLVHSMGAGGGDFAVMDRAAAHNMAEAAHAGGVERIIYLSGILPRGEVSSHLRSRAEVADILSTGRVPVTVLRAAQILGSGSASFEIIRYLADRLPVMVTPRWVRTEAQPIAVRDVLEYLVRCLDTEETIGRTFDIGGPDVLSYRELFQIYAQEAGLARRWIIPVPLLTPTLSSYWVGLVTPVPPGLARPLIKGLSNRAVCDDLSIRDLIPMELTSVREAIRSALDRVRQHMVPTCWFDAGHARLPEWAACGDAPYAGGTVLEYAVGRDSEMSVDAVWRAIASIGGERGWYHANWMWRLRGVLDSVFGGVGLRRGRRHPAQLRVDDGLDFWRVLDVQDDGDARRLALLAEMRLPGEAMLELSVTRTDTGSQLFLRARFLPRGLWGIAYWQIMRPFHAYVFPGLVSGILEAARQG